MAAELKEGSMNMASFIEIEDEDEERSEQREQEDGD
jgi:hypothetical protein